MTPADRIAIGDRIDRRMGELGITREQFRRDLGYEYVRQHQWIRGERTPNAGSLIRICRYLKVSADEILGLDTIAMPEPRFRGGVGA